MIGTEIANKLIEKYNPESVLFCPYKEEMWDSMHTIYNEFILHEDIRTEIMPIAYYTLHNGKIDNLNIEFDEAENFPMMLTKGLSMNGCIKKWDIIIIHYPYDNMNTLTRPLLLSNELKSFCNHLVLVSYAVIGDRLPMETELLYSAVRNSDLVIFETEPQAKEAERILKGKPNWHGECAGWGSAKYDMIEIAPIPPEWVKKAEGKKVILLQTSIVAYMKNRNKLQQIENIIARYQNNDKVCLIWRPHPLYRTTVISQNRHELRRYANLVEDFKKNPNFIYDDTMHPESAIKFADEMISDPSSLVILWNHTGKKITMLD